MWRFFIWWKIICLFGHFNYGILAQRICDKNQFRIEALCSHAKWWKYTHATDVCITFARKLNPRPIGITFKTAHKESARALRLLNAKNQWAARFSFWIQVWPHSCYVYVFNWLKCTIALHASFDCIAAYWDRLTCYPVSPYRFYNIAKRINWTFFWIAEKSAVQSVLVENDLLRFEDISQSRNESIRSSAHTSNAPLCFPWEMHCRPRWGALSISVPL